MTKLTVVYVVAAVFLYLFIKKLYRELLIYMLVFAALISPWFIFNLATYGKLTATDLHIDFVKPIANPQNIDFGIAFVLSQLSSMFGNFFVPQEFGYPYLPIEILTVIHVLSVLLLILFVSCFVYVLRNARSVILGETTNIEIKKEFQMFTYVWALCCLLSPFVLIYGTIMEDVSILIGRYLYVIVLPLSILLMFIVYKTSTFAERKWR